MTSTQSKSIALNGMAQKRIAKFDETIKNLVDIQCSNGNWNYSPYMMGLANGLIMARAILSGESPQFLSAPEEWLQDRDAEPRVTSPEEEAELLYLESDVVSSSDEPRG
jgi:hypothetical protein